MTKPTPPPRDNDARDQDRPVNLPNAADHRPDGGADGSNTAPVNAVEDAPKDPHQNHDAKLPNPSQIQKQQRSPNMNTEKNK